MRCHVVGGSSVRGPIKKRDPYIKAVRGSALVPYNPQEDAANWEGCYTYNAAIYAMKRDFFLRENAFVSQNSVPLFMDRFFSADIDEEIDAKVAELYFDYLDWAPFGKASRSGSVTALPDPVQKILLSKVSDLDDVFESPEVRASVAAFAPSYVLVALPKSSSTYSTQVLGKILGATVYQDLVTQDRCTPKDISLPGLINARDRATISQLHLTATGANLRILRNFRIPTVILLRSLFDVVVSLRDHMNSNPYFSSVLIPKDFAALSESDKLDYIIDTAVPWIITLYTSWVQAIERGDAKAKFVYFEDLVRDPAPFFASICAFADGGKYRSV